MAEKSILSCVSEKSRGRLFPEEYPFERSQFQRDRDRIIHSNAFRRLEYKTQVFVNHEGDHYRTRLTHSLEVSQLARSLTRSLNLDEELAEAIALAHDLGHTPFGHAGEDALKKVYPDFDHNGQTLKIVTKLEDRYADFDGLNLTWETLEGIAKHNGPNKKPPKEIAKFNKEFDLEMHTYASLEAQVAGLADDIAYNNHDIDDGLRAGLFIIEDLLHLPLVGEIFREMRQQYAGVEEGRVIHESLRRVMSAMVKDLLDTTRENVSGLKSIDEVRGAKFAMADFSDDMKANLEEIKDWLMVNMYRHYKVNRMTKKAENIVTRLFEFFVEDPNCMPKEWRLRADNGDVKEVAADYIAGMTDRFAMQEYKKIFEV